eukprot:10168322-Heterocapsa_arctica.AAC.1
MATEAAERAGIFMGTDPQSQDQGTQTDSTSSPSDHLLWQGTQHERERLWWAGFEAAREKVVQILLEAGASLPPHPPENGRNAERASSSTDRMNFGEEETHHDRPSDASGSGSKGAGKGFWLQSNAMIEPSIDLSKEEH